MENYADNSANRDIKNGLADFMSFGEGRYLKMICMSWEVEDMEEYSVKNIYFVIGS